MSSCSFTARVGKRADTVAQHGHTFDFDEGRTLSVSNNKIEPAALTRNLHFAIGDYACQFFDATVLYRVGDQTVGTTRIDADEVAEMRLDKFERVRVLAGDAARP